MKIRDRRLVAAGGWLAARAAVLLVRSLRVKAACAGPDVRPRPDLPPGPRYIYAVWHENLLLPTVADGGPDLAVLISKHADGRLLGALIAYMGMGQVLGSTNAGSARGGVEAVRQLVRGDAGRRHLAVTPDGPRGPRRQVQPGIVYVASRTGMQVVPLGVGYDRPWRAGSWDRFAVPKPGSRARLVFGRPVPVPDRLRADDLEPYRAAVERELVALTEAAERWAATGRLSLPTPADPPLRRAA